MLIEDLDLDSSLEKARQLLKEDKSISPAVQAVMEVLILLVTILRKRLGLSSRTSSMPPSQDPNRERKLRSDKGGKRKPGGQAGHTGSTLRKFKNPDEITEIAVNRTELSPERSYEKVGYKSRQVLDVKVSLHVREYRAEILEDDKGKRYVASFPAGVKKAIQYGSGVKAASVYLSQYQLIPLQRVQEQFNDQMGLPIGKGSIGNFNQEVYERLERFESWAKEALLASPLNHADETGINIGGKRRWLHTLCNEQITLYHADEQRGKDAMDRMGVLPDYKGRLCHDHWKPYYRYTDIVHVLCNAHHLRELERVIQEDNHLWAKDLKQLLLDLNQAVDAAGGALSDDEIKSYTETYHEILNKGDLECPLPPPTPPGKRGRPKKSFSRNLLERLRNFEKDTLRFIAEDIVPFTNNQGENDLRMTKVQQKISGCFRSMDGAKTFCRIRSFLSTCRKNKVSPSEALRDLFHSNFPRFMNLD